MMEPLNRFLFNHWQRKILAVVLAMITWLVISHSLTEVKLVVGIPVRVVNLPGGKTIDGLQENGLLDKRVSLNIEGNRNAMLELSGKDLEVVIDASGKPEEWVAQVNKKNLVSLNPLINIDQMIVHVTPLQIFIKETYVVQDKVDVVITSPIGDSPKGYQFLDIWPYRISVKVTGSADSISRLKERILRLTFNLNVLQRKELDELLASQGKGRGDEINYLIPKNWLADALSSLIELPFEMDEGKTPPLRINFLREDLIPLNDPIPVTLFFSPKYALELNPEIVSILPSPLIVRKDGLLLIAPPLYAYGVSRTFLEIVKDSMQIAIVMAPKEDRKHLQWTLQFVPALDLENRYVYKLLEEVSTSHDLSDGSRNREEYLRNRFRSYMTRLRLYSSDKKKMALDIELDKSKKVTVQAHHD